MKRIVVLAFAAAALLATQSLFANGQSESSKTSGPVSIQVAYPVAVDAPIAKILNGFISGFEKANPGVTVKPVYSGGYTDVTTAVQTAIQGGGKPPALAVMLATDLYDLTNAGYIEPLDPYLAKMKNEKAYLGDFLPAFLANSRYDGKIWSIPFQRSVVVLYYNKSLFKQAGLSAPDSWASLAQDAQKLTKRQNGKVTRWGILWSSVGLPYWLFQPLAIGAGQNIVGSNDTKVYFDNPDVISAINYYISLSKTYHATPPGAQDTWGVSPGDLASGRAAMIMHSSGSLAGILKQANFDVGVMPLPGKKPGTYASVPGGGNLYLLKGSSQAQKDAAFKFIEYLTRPENVAEFSIKTGYVATRKSAYDTPEMKAYLKKVPQAGAIRDILKYAGKEMSVQDLGKVRNIFQNYLEEAFNGKLSASQAMSKAQQQADAALKPFKQ